MSWLKFDDHFDEHPKVVGLTDAAFRLSVRAIAYSSRNLTDGVLSEAAVRSLVGTKARAERLSAELVAAGLWEVATQGWQIHDYNDFQPTKDIVLERRRIRAEAGRLGGLRSGEARSKGQADPKQLASSQRSKDEANANPGPVPEPDRGSQSPSGDLEGEGLEDQLAEVVGILGASRLADAFEGKRAHLAAALARHTGQDAVQTARDLVEKVPQVERPGSAVGLFESWLVKAPRVRQRKRIETADEKRERLEQKFRFAPSRGG